MKKTFRGLLADGAIQRIRLGTVRGEIGYSIVKFEIIAQNNGTTDYEHTCQVFTNEPDAASDAINFDNPQLLAVAYTEGNNSSNYIGQPLITIFDAMKVNQDIFITHVDAKGALNCNYYLELETSKLTQNEATVATLKDMRGNYTNQDP